MIYYENTSDDPFFNLAVEEYLLYGNDLDSVHEAEFSEPILLLWRNRPTVVVGRHQNTLEEINIDVVRNKGIDVVRRMSGGGAVYHDWGNLNFSLIVGDRKTSVRVTPNDALSPGNAEGNDLQTDFKRLTAPILSAFQHWGIPAEYSGRNDLMIGEKKFSGVAQYRHRGRILHHGTLLFDSDLDTVAAVLHVGSEKFLSKAVSSVRTRVTNLKEYFPIDMPMTDVWSLRDALLTFWKQNEKFETRTFTAEQRKGIERLRREKYATWDWNYGRSPKFDMRARHRFDWGTLEVALSIEQGKIVDGRIFGDFFSTDDPRKLIAAMIGMPLDRDFLLSHLTASLVSDIFPAMTLMQFVDFLFR